MAEELESSLPDDIIRLGHEVLEAACDRDLQLATAESCTGGLVCGAVTEIAGSSSVLDRGFITYSNEAKMELLGVSSDIIETFGAVSIACVWAMAQGALANSKADVAVAISGVAGPGGGTPTKPVGTVVFARATRGQEDQPEGELKSFGEIGRAEVRRQATLCALELLLP